MMTLEDAALRLRKCGLAARVNQKEGSLSGGASSSAEGHLEVFHQTFVIFADGSSWRFSVEQAHGVADIDGSAETIAEAVEMVLQAMKCDTR